MRSGIGEPSVMFVSWLVTARIGSMPASTLLLADSLISLLNQVHNLLCFRNEMYNMYTYLFFLHAFYLFFLFVQVKMGCRKSCCMCVAFIG